MVKLFILMVILVGVCFFALGKLNEEVKKACETQTTVRTETCIIMATE
jgi:hypothetical protein